MERNQLQFFVKKTDKNLIEIVGAFDISKIKIGFRTYDNTNAKGSKLNNKVDFYMDIAEFELLCHNLLSGITVKDIHSGKKFNPIYKGSKRNEEIKSRILLFNKSNNGLFFNAYEGPGKITDTGAVMPTYKTNDAENKASIQLNFEEIKMFALQGKRACDHYYLHYFGKEQNV